ncbi:hypothetical protein WJX73_004100 [Symbiochloris irregularis]|uniref:AAA+ ATPase domain-containing protein n=1 Tax=Symbiochloris irregularis TaxID=706552 RepID=A0AAW1PJJ4_9CHLO
MILPSFAKRRRLRKLQVAAARDPSNAAGFHALVAELNRQNKGSAVINLVDEGSYSINEAVMSEYLAAHVRNGRIQQYRNGKLDRQLGDKRSLEELLSDVSKRLQNPDKTKPGLGHARSRPLHVRMQLDEAVAASSGGSLMGKLLSWLGAFSILAIAGVFGMVIGIKWSAKVISSRRVVAKPPAAASTTASPFAGTPPSSLYGLVTSPKEYKDENIPEVSRKRFTDVRGCPEAKAELEEVVDYLRQPDKFTRLGGQLPKGVLLTGPPGTGKTLLARAVAGEAGVPFFHRAGAEFDEMLVGVGSARVRALFAAAKVRAPCIVFIDELDAVGQTRQQFDAGGCRRTLNQLLVEMDGFEPNSGVIVMAATNMDSALDPALLRAGRFDRHVAVPLPDVHGRLDLLDFYLQDKPVSPDVDTTLLARSTPGFSGAELCNLVNESALLAARGDAEQITARLLDEACDKIRMGVERKSLVRLHEAKRRTAFHEGGHVLVALSTDGADPVHKATIVPRGHALGYVAQVPDGDESSMTQHQLRAFIDCCMGGRVAEEIIFGQEHVSAGASDDLKKATQLARHMVMQWGMSAEVGPMYVDERSMGPEMRQRIDAEVKRMLSQAHARVTELLEQRKGQLHNVADALLEHETLNLAELQQAAQGKLSKKIALQHPEDAQPPSKLSQPAAESAPAPAQPVSDGVGSQEPLSSLHRLPTVTRLAAEGSAAWLAPFVADPPTATMQRLKALVTGGLPTFIDIGQSFSAAAVIEDSLIQQFKDVGLRLAFAGDDTWTALFPAHFKPALPFPSFNLHDFNTTDQGVWKVLLPWINDASQWDVLIAHYLGADHIGHAHTADSPLMAEKLAEMDDHIRQVVEAMLQQAGPGQQHHDTLLLVFGDHGMTAAGEHGGGSVEETHSALFALSLRKLHRQRQLQARMRPATKADGRPAAKPDPPAADLQQQQQQPLSQVDFASSIAWLMGVPIPFGNIGRVSKHLLDLADHRYSALAHQQALLANVHQVRTYLAAYQCTGAHLSAGSMSRLSAVYASAEEACIHFTHNCTPSLHLQWKQRLQGIWGVLIELASLWVPGGLCAAFFLGYWGRLGNASSASQAWSTDGLHSQRMGQAPPAQLDHDAASTAAGVLLGLLAEQLFYCTGHTCSFSGLNYAAGYAGLSDFSLCYPNVAGSIAVRHVGFTFV